MKDRKDILADCSISDWRKCSAYVRVQYLNPIKCVFICINLKLLLKEHICIYICICCVLNRLILRMYAFNV